MSRGYTELARPFYLIHSKGTHVDKIDERIPHADANNIAVSHEMLHVTCKHQGSHLLAVIGKVNSQIHEVVLSPTGFVNDPLQHGLVDFVRNVPEHDLDSKLDRKYC